MDGGALECSLEPGTSVYHIIDIDNFTRIGPAVTLYVTCHLGVPRVISEGRGRALICQQQVITGSMCPRK